MWAINPEEGGVVFRTVTMTLVSITLCHRPYVCRLLFWIANIDVSVQRTGRLGAPLSVLICTRVLKKHVLGLLFAMLLNAQKTMLSLEVPRTDYDVLFA